MDRAVDEMSEAGDDFITAATAFIRSSGDSSGRITPESAAAMQGFKEKWDIFMEKCDLAEELVDTARRNLAGKFAGDDAGDDDSVENSQIAEISNADDSMSVVASDESFLSPSQTSGGEDAAAI